MAKMKVDKLGMMKKKGKKEMKMGKMTDMGFSGTPKYPKKRMASKSKVARLKKY